MNRSNSPHPDDKVESDHQPVAAAAVAERFSQGVADLLLTLEEWRQSSNSNNAKNNKNSSLRSSSSNSKGSNQNSSIRTGTETGTPIVVSQDSLMEWQRHADRALDIAHALSRWATEAAAVDENPTSTNINNTDHAETFAVLLDHALRKATTMAHECLQLCCLHGSILEPQQTPQKISAEQDFSSGGDNDEDDPVMSLEEQRKTVQGAIARLTEVSLALHVLRRDQTLLHQSTTTLNPSPKDGDNGAATEITQLYVQYQRQLLRLRVKPAIAQLVLERRKGTFDTNPTAPRQHQQQNVTAAASIPGVLILETEEEEDDNVNHHNANRKPLLAQDQPHHAPVLTLILGEAAALIHPLAAWMNHLPQPLSLPSSDPSGQCSIPEDSSDSLNVLLHRLCQDSIVTLDEQAQTLAKTVSDWFWQDRPVDEWLQQSSTLAQADDVLYNSDVALMDERDLARLDTLVEEMAYSSQIFERYEDLMESTGVANDGTNVISSELLPEWTVKYGALERFLALQQWQSALQHAAPVTIVMGTEIRVPSVVEDAQYLSTRALERAATTRSLQAIATVAYAICHDVWSTEVLNEQSSPTPSSKSCSAVYQALLDEMGCWTDIDEVPDSTLTRKNDSAVSSPQSGGFAAAFLDALDDDIRSDKQQLKSSKKRTPKAPSSGNFLLSFVGDQDKIQKQQLDTLFCLLNGIYASAGASRALVASVDELLLISSDETVTSETQRAASMITLVREELSRFSDGYQRLLADRMERSIHTWCGDPVNSQNRPKKDFSCFNDVAQFFESEEYNLNANTIGPAESNDRLEEKLLGSLLGAKFLQQLPNKCEGEVLQIASECVASMLVEIILKSLWKLNDSGVATKCFSDWGALLLSKQSRMLQTYVSTTMIQPSVANQGGADVSAGTSSAILQIWEKLSQVVCVLQLEKPSDWLAYHSSSILTTLELSQSLHLRTDFSNDAIENVVLAVSPRDE